MEYKGAHAELRQQNKEWAILYLGGKCFICESVSELEFDHIVHGTKSFSIAGQLTRSRKALEQELKKCQLLCHDCHKKKTKKEKARTAYKLDPDVVKDIRSFLAAGLTPKQIAEIYEVSPTTIRVIRRGDSWT